MTTQEVLKQCKVDGLVVRLPEIKLERNEYIDVKKSLELIGGKWKGGKVQGFVFEQDPTELLNQVADGVQRNLKKEYQFFPTPKEVADLMMQQLPTSILTNEKILEPSAGDGALIKAFNHYVGVAAEVDCFEIMDLNRTKLSNIDAAHLIGNDFVSSVLIDDLNLVRNQYDIIIANPPFTKNQDIEHIACMYMACKPGGTIVTLSSTSWQRGSQQLQADFEKWLRSVSAKITVIPAGAFKESGTNIETLMIVIKKQVDEVIEFPNSLETKLNALRNYAKNTNSLSSENNEDNKTIINKAIAANKELINMIDEEPVFERQCRVCGCIENDCSQCIEKTGMACHWVEEDLCSACKEPSPEEILEKIEQSMNESAKIFNQLKKDLSPKNNNDMSFFQQLAALGNVDLSIRIKQKNETLTLSITPGNSSNITPVLVTGTPAELDAEFLNSIAPQVQSISGIVTNIKDVKAEAAKLEEDSKKPKEKPAPAAPKKAEPKKVEKAKVSEPALFGSEDDGDDTQNEEE